MAIVNDDIIFSISFKKGQADKHRLPLNHVINTLQQIENIIRDVGRQVQRDSGVEDPTGDFGIELLAGRTGLAFRKGSLLTSATITRDVSNGILAINALIDTTEMLQNNKNFVLTDYGEHVLKRLTRISDIQEEDNTELHLALSQNNHVLNSTKLGEKGRQTLRSMEAVEAGIEAITLYGKLRELKDLSRSDEQSGFFWGELLEDNGSVWRIRFRDAEQSRVLALFRKQVCIDGDATYFRTKTPRVDAAHIEEENVPDYLAAFERFGEIYADVFQDREAEDILDDIRE
jgi:hypothetical protein